MVDVFSALSQDDKEKITRVRKFYNNTLHLLMDTDSWLKPWNEAKNQYLNQLFNDNLILNKPITYQISDTELAEAISEDIFHNFSYYNDLQLSQVQKAGKIWRDKFLESFPIGLDLIEKRNTLITLIDSFTLGTNIYHDETTTIVIPNSGKHIKIQKGCKASKIIGQLCREIGIYDLWEPVRLKISQIRNNNHLTGNLHLSIHPIDFFTSSVNDYNWSSCMEFGRGDYCRGVIEMMNSPMIVQAYLTGNNETFEFIPDVPWYNKKWREFFLVTPTMISGIKGYPYWNQDLERITIEWIYSLMQENHLWTDKTWSHITEYSLDKEIPCLPTEIIEYINCGPAMYDDFYTNETYQAIFAENFDSSKRIFYSGLSECLNCGEDCEDHYFSSLVCSSCDPHAECYCCGDRYEIDEMYEVNGLYYCSYCYNELLFCQQCDDAMTPDDCGLHFHLAQHAQDGSTLALPDSICLCSSCLESILKPGKREHSGYITEAIRRYICVIYVEDIEDKFFDEDHKSIVIGDIEYPTNIKDYKFFVTIQEF